MSHRRLFKDRICLLARRNMEIKFILLLTCAPLIIRLRLRRGILKVWLLRPILISRLMLIFLFLIVFLRLLLALTLVKIHGLILRCHHLLLGHVTTIILLHCLVSHKFWVLRHHHLILLSELVLVLVHHH